MKVFILGVFVIFSSFGFAELDKKCVLEQEQIVGHALKVLSTQASKDILDIADAKHESSELDGKFSRGDMEILARTRTVPAELRQAAKVMERYFNALDRADEPKGSYDGVASTKNIDIALKNFEQSDGEITNLIATHCTTLTRYPRGF